MVLSGSGAAEGLRWLRSRRRHRATERRDDASAAERFMNMALRLEARLEQQQHKIDAQDAEIAALKTTLSDQDTRLATQAGLLRESLHLIDELLDPTKPTPQMSAALRAAYENRGHP